MKIHPSHLNVCNLFGNNFIFRVPKYQRNYAWDAEEVGDFLRDLSECVAALKAKASKKHFFGGLVTVSVPIHGSARLDHLVIDGQQRLATFVMLAAQLKWEMRRLAETVDKTKETSPHAFLVQRAQALEDGFLIYQDKVGLSIKTIARLELSKADRAFFSELLLNKEPATERASHKRLVAAYRTIGVFLRKLVEAESDDQERALALSLVDDAFSQDFTVIHMATGSESDAYRLFQVLNDRGTGLTEGELLRARTLEMLESAGDTARQDAVEHAWDEILAGDATPVDDGLRWVYASHIGARPGATTMFDDYLTAFFPSSAKTTLTPQEADDVVARVKQICADFKLAMQLRSGVWPFAQSTVSAWERARLKALVDHLGHTNCMPLLISACLLSEEAFSGLVQALERFVFRYKVIANAHIGPATAQYHSFARKIRENPGGFKLKDLTDQLAELIDRSAGDPLFQEGLRSLRYKKKEGNGAIRYLLVTLEAYVRWYDNGAPGKPSCYDTTIVVDYPSTTIEHVYAGGGDSALEALRDTIGNLTILGPKDNDAVGNKPFDQKRPVFEKSNLLLNQEIAKNAEWTESVVKARQERLIQMATKVFVV